MTSSTKRFAKALSAVAVCAMAGLGGNAFAVQTWENLSSDNPSVCTQSGNSNYTQNCGSGLTLSGISTGSSTNTSGTGSTFYSAAVYDWGSAGFGVVGTNENSVDVGPHATDNKYGSEAMLLSFANGAVSLGSIKIGWNGSDSPTYTKDAGLTTYTNYNDSDISVLAWTGVGSVGAISLGSAPVDGHIGAGWTLVGNYANVGQLTNPDNTVAINTNIVSSSWLIAAYSSAYGGTAISDGTCASTFKDSYGKTQTVSGCSDAFKLVGITTTPTVSVPEPGSLALMAIGLVGMGTLRRRQLAAKEAAQGAAQDASALQLA